MLPKTNEEMVEALAGAGYIKSKRVKEAFLKTDRKKFIPQDCGEFCYANMPYQTLRGQTISAPSIAAEMVEMLEVERGNRVLEVGSGSGYLLCILSYLSEPGLCIGIERINELVEFGRKRLKEEGRANAKVEEGDGSEGWPAEAPYDKIIFSGAMPSIESLETAKEQLKEKGIIVAPVGAGVQRLVRWKNGAWEEIEDVIFVPIIGKKGFKLID
ncbi:MAG: protein-L-isoaspartate O-methyltransferase [Candidatus Anstonellales archaeon]